ncbi:MAG TPA: type VI secretion system tube protein Hcp [Bacteroidales bacterium]|nr:type VI secretion system tube protein Hcp [Bacteroidales bacterium]
MALNAHMRLWGATQGQIKGSVTRAGRVDSIMVIGFSHEVISPRHAASGLPTGKR